MPYNRDAETSGRTVVWEARARQAIGDPHGHAGLERSRSGEEPEVTAITQLHRHSNYLLSSKGVFFFYYYYLLLFSKENPPGDAALCCDTGLFAFRYTPPPPQMWRENDTLGSEAQLDANPSLTSPRTNETLSGERL